MTRITVNMVKKSIKGTLKEEEMDKVLNDWISGINDDDSVKTSEKMGYMLGLMFASLYMSGDIPEEKRIEMIKENFDKIAKIFMTPKAWDLMKNRLIEDINKNVK